MGRANGSPRRRGRADPHGPLLVLLTMGCRTLDRFEEERSYLFGIGIPAGFLPGAREIGCDDLA